MTKVFLIWGTDKQEMKEGDRLGEKVIQRQKFSIIK